MLYIILIFPFIFGFFLKRLDYFIDNNQKACISDAAIVYLCSIIIPTIAPNISIGTLIGNLTAKKIDSILYYPIAILIITSIILHLNVLELHPHIILLTALFSYLDEIKPFSDSRPFLKLFAIALFPILPLESASLLAFDIGYETFKNLNGVKS